MQIKKLKDLIEKECFEFRSISKTIRKPNFKEKGKCHDWKNYIPDFISDDWENLTLKEKFYIWVVAENAAGKKSWD